VTTVRADFEVLRRFVVEMARMLRVSLVVVEVSTLVVLGARHAARHDGRCVRHFRWPGCLQRRSIFCTFRQPVRLSRLQHTRLHVTAISIVARHDLPQRSNDPHQQQGEARRRPHLKPLLLCGTWVSVQVYNADLVAQSQAYPGFHNEGGSQGRIGAESGSVGDGSPPVGSRDKAPVGRFGDEDPQKLKQICEIMYDF